MIETALGPVGLAYRSDAVLAVQLPEVTSEATSSRLRATARRARHPAQVVDVSDDLDDLVEPATTAAELIKRLLNGEAVDLGPVPVDVSACPPFHQRIYDVTRTIKPGQVLTYGQVAAEVGEPGAAQAVGQAMGANPVPIIIPCHRVVGANGKLVGFSADGGVETKRKMLLIEGSTFVAPSLFD